MRCTTVQTVQKAEHCHTALFMLWGGSHGMFLAVQGKKWKHPYSKKSLTATGDCAVELPLKMAMENSSVMRRVGQHTNAKLSPLP